MLRSFIEPARRPSDSRHENVETLLDDLRTARDRANAWLLERISANGEPAHAQQPRAWGRIPWAPALGGELESAAAVVGWAERAALAEDGGFRPEFSQNDQAIMQAYPLAHMAIGAWLIERYDIALRIMHKLRALQHPSTGGIETGLMGPSGGAVQDLLVTAQTGVAALFTGQMDLASRINGWIEALYADQPALPHKLFTMRESSALLTELEPPLAWMGSVDFRQPRQAFYHPGMAAAFTAGFAMQTGNSRALALARQFLTLNVDGTSEQFSDLGSVQICKFGWGASTLLLADPDQSYIDHVERMAHWFIARQDADGGWSPSHFIAPQPNDAQRMAKTAEHAMESNTILAALGVARGRSQVNEAEK